MAVAKLKIRKLGKLTKAQREQIAYWLIDTAKQITEIKVGEYSNGTVEFNLIWEKGGG